MSWASRRSTTRLEDLAYCLLGLFDVNMPLIYGEGDKAFTRLQNEIIRQSDDESIFAWTAESTADDITKSAIRCESMLALSPAAFRYPPNIDRPHPESRTDLDYMDRRLPYTITNKGLHLHIPTSNLIRLAPSVHQPCDAGHLRSLDPFQYQLIALACGRINDLDGFGDKLIYVLLARYPEDSAWTRVALPFHIGKVLSHEDVERASQPVQFSPILISLGRTYEAYYWRIPTPALQARDARSLMTFNTRNEQGPSLSDLGFIMNLYLKHSKRLNWPDELIA